MSASTAHYPGISVLTFAFAAFVMYASPTAASEMNRHTAMATDAGSNHLFTDNPGIADPDKFNLGYQQNHMARDTELTLVNDTQQPHVKNKMRQTDYGVGLLFPLGGGSAFGLLGGLINQDLSTKMSTSDRDTQEKYRRKDLELRFIVKLVDRIRAGVGVRYARLDNDIAGDFFVDDDERSPYRGSMTGFNVGLYYTDDNLGFGLAFTPALRGKASLNSEKIIIAESGFINLDIIYGKIGDWRWGLAAKRWLHKRDDRSGDYTVPGSEREVMLMGVDFEQFILPVTRYGLGMDLPKAGDVAGRFDVSRTDYVFLSDAEQVPGDDPNAETAIKGWELKAAAVYNPADFAIQAGIALEQRQKSGIDDQHFRLAGKYKDYKTLQQTIFAIFTYAH